MKFRTNEIGNNLWWATRLFTDMQFVFWTVVSSFLLKWMESSIEYFKPSSVNISVKVITHNITLTVLCWDWLVNEAALYKSSCLFVQSTIKYTKLLNEAGCYRWRHTLFKFTQSIWSRTYFSLQRWQCTPGQLLKSEIGAHHCRSIPHH